MNNEKFFLGAAMSGHQVNGGPHDQWTAWEEAQAEQLAATADQRVGWLPNWPEVKAQATDPDNYRSGTGIEHQKHYRQDLQLLKKLGLDSLRFGIEWAELEPHEGQWSEAAIKYYHEYFAELKKENITPIVTLWHWTHPLWFEAKGGFTKRTNLRYFERYIEKVVSEFGSDFDFTTVLNEPNSYVGMSFTAGAWPPQKRSPYLSYIVSRNLIVAHRRAYQIIKHERDTIQVGISYIVPCIKPLHPKNLFDQLATRISRWIAAYWFLKRVRHSLDFMGVSFYHTAYVHHLRQQNPPDPVNDMGWYMEPGALQTVLEQIYQRYHLPIIVSENGLADAKDQHREWWIRESLLAVTKARASGVDIFGYLHWSLLDNFEWAYGWWPKFGLIEVDRSKPGMPRIIRKSAKTLHAAAKDAGLIQS